MRLHGSSDVEGVAGRKLVCRQFRIREVGVDYPCDLCVLNDRLAVQVANAGHLIRHNLCPAQQMSGSSNAPTAKLLLRSLRSLTEQTQDTVAFITAAGVWQHSDCGS